MKTGWIYTIAFLTAAVLFSIFDSPVAVGFCVFGAFCGLARIE